MKSRLMGFLATALALCGALAVEAGAEPASSPAVREAEKKATRAKALFMAKSFAEAANLFLEAHIELRKAGVERPAVLFNAGRAFQEDGNLLEARAQLRLVMAMEGADAATRSDAQRLIDEIEGKLRAPTPVSTTPQTQVSTPAVVNTKKTGRLPERKFPWIKSGAVLTLGAVAVGTWAFAFSQAESARAIVPRKEADIARYGELQKSAETWQIGAIVLGVASGAAAVWTAADYWFAPTIALNPHASGGPSVVGLLVGAAF